MARITVEDCLEKVNNRFALVHMASKRVRQLRKGDEPTIASKNRDIVVSLREVAAGNVLKADESTTGTLSDNLKDLIPEESSVEETEEINDKNEEAKA